MGIERKAVKFTPGGKEQELSLPFAESEWPSLGAPVPVAMPPTSVQEGHLMLLPPNSRKEPDPHLSVGPK